MAQEAVRALNAQGILLSFAKVAPARVMLDAGSLAFVLSKGSLLLRPLSSEHGP
jgi:hypothetical protein